MLLKAWFLMVCSVLVLSLISSVFSFSGTVLQALWILILLITIALTARVYLEQPATDVKEIQKTYAEFIQKKDKDITALQEKNKLILKTAVKHSEENIELAELKRKWEAKYNG